jgi:hypothetical protein
MSRANIKEDALNALSRSLEEVSETHFIYDVVYDLGIPTFLPRQFKTDMVWRWRNEGLLEVYSNNCDDSDRSSAGQYVHAKSSMKMQFRALLPRCGISQTEVTLKLSEWGGGGGGGSI